MKVGERLLIFDETFKSAIFLGRLLRICTSSEFAASQEQEPEMRLNLNKNW